MIKFLKSLQFIFMPNYWSINHRYSKQWDEKLNTLLNKHEFTDIDRYTAKLGDVEVWISNHPYGSFSVWGSGLYFRPSRLIILKAGRKLKKAKEALYKAKHDDILSNIK